jgi:DNA-binding MarR family transcriptional regulator
MATETGVRSGGGRLEETELGAWRGFLRAHAALVRDLDAELQSAHGLSLSSYEVLLLLAGARERSLRMSELAKATLITLGGVTRLVDRLEREGLVTRERCASDARGILAVLTAAGLERLREAGPTHRAGIRRRFLAHLTVAQQEELARIWGAIVPDGATPAAQGPACEVD